MAEFASNCPISRPINTGWKTDWDLGGWSWSYQYGLFFGSVEETVPFKLPTFRLNSKGWQDVAARLKRY